MAAIMPFSHNKNKSLMCVCKVLAQNTPQIFVYSMLKLLLFEG